jgi:hypothetical protein
VVQHRLRSLGVHIARFKGPRESQRSFAGLTFAWRTQATDFGRRGPTVRSMTFESRNVRARSRRFLSRAKHPRQKGSLAGRLYSRGESRARGGGQWRAVRPEPAEPARRIRQPAACAPRADWTLPIARRGGRSGERQMDGRAGTRGSIERSLESTPQATVARPTSATTTAKNRMAIIALTEHLSLSWYS